MEPTRQITEKQQGILTESPRINPEHVGVTADDDDSIYLSSLHNHWNSTSPACTLHLPRGVCGCPWPHNITSRPCVATAGSSRGTQRCSFRGSQRSGSAAVGVRGVSSKSKRATYQLGSSAARQLPGHCNVPRGSGTSSSKMACWRRSGSSQTAADGRRCPRGRASTLRVRLLQSSSGWRRVRVVWRRVRPAESSA